MLVYRNFQYRADGRKYAHFEGIFETLIYLIHANIDINKSFWYSLFLRYIEIRKCILKYILKGIFLCISSLKSAYIYVQGGCTCTQ